MAENKVVLRGDFIVEVQVVGVQNAASIDLMGREISTMLTNLRAHGRPGLVLDDVIQLGSVDDAGRRMVVDLGKRLDYDRLAMVGSNGLVKLGANLMLRAMGRGDKIRYFDDRDKAIAWLKELQS
jgi:hypothetical protein